MIVDGGQDQVGYFQQLTGCESMNGSLGRYFWHMFTRVFELASYRLWKLGIFRPLSVDERGGACAFEFACELSNIRSMALRHRKEGLSFDELLSSFVELFSQYKGLEIEAETEFTVDGELELALEYLLSLGYVKKTRNRYVWTEKIDPAMRGALLRREDPNCPSNNWLY